jgi:hypothetical protein
VKLGFAVEHGPTVGVLGELRKEALNDEALRLGAHVHRLGQVYLRGASDGDSLLEPIRPKANRPPHGWPLRRFFRHLFAE